MLDEKKYKNKKKTNDGMKWAGWKGVKWVYILTFYIDSKKCCAFENVLYL